VVGRLQCDDHDAFWLLYFSAYTVAVGF